METFCCGGATPAAESRVRPGIVALMPPFGHFSAASVLYEIGMRACSGPFADGRSIGGFIHSEAGSLGRAVPKMDIARSAHVAWGRGVETNEGRTGTRSRSGRPCARRSRMRITFVQILGGMLIATGLVGPVAAQETAAEAAVAKLVAPLLLIGNALIHSATFG